LGILVPLHNELVAPPWCLERLDAALQVKPQLRAQITVVDDGPTDATWSVLPEPEIRCPRVRGLRLARPIRGHGLQVAWSESSSKILAYLDVDLVHLPNSAPCWRRSAATPSIAPSAAASCWATRSGAVPAENLL
jgi:hypothetical protein